MQPIQMQLSRNQQMFSQFFSIFPETTLNLEYFEKKDEAQKLFFSEIIHCKKWGNLNPKKPHVRTLMDSQHVKESETMHESARQYFCHIF